MLKKNRFIIGVAGVSLFLLAGMAVFIWLFVSYGGRPSLYFLPRYATEQVPSAHPGYRHTTLASEGVIYVNDYDESSLRLIDYEPAAAVGRTPFGGGKICAIPGQPLTAYLAADCGSEMPAYEVFRNIRQPPFDWRHATFQKMQLAIPVGPAANKQTTDSALIEDVVRTLMEGAPTTTPSALVTNIHEVHLFSEQLPGLTYSPSIYIDQTGSVYLAESFTIEDYKALKIQARWIPASALFSQWVQSR